MRIGTQPHVVLPLARRFGTATCPFPGFRSCCFEPGPSARVEAKQQAMLFRHVVLAACSDIVDHNRHERRGATVSLDPASHFRRQRGIEQPVGDEQPEVRYPRDSFRLR